MTSEEFYRSTYEGVKTLALAVYNPKPLPENEANADGKWVQVETLTLVSLISP